MQPGLAQQLLWVMLLAGYVIGVLLATQLPYRWMVARGIEPIRAVYYNRKIVHMAAGGVASLIVPLVFTDFWLPALAGLALAALTGAAHLGGWRMYWFQTAENSNDVKFALMWALSLALLWWLLGDPWLAILPSLYLAFGDGVTGIVRNALIRRRSKHPLGNLFMLLVCAPLGWIIGAQADPPLAWWGLLSAAAASWVERYEFGPIDDNVLITVTASVVLLAGALLHPL